MLRPIASDISGSPPRLRAGSSAGILGDAALRRFAPTEVSEPAPAGGGAAGNGFPVAVEDTKPGSRRVEADPESPRGCRRMRRMDPSFAPSDRPVREILDSALAGDRISAGDAHRCCSTASSSSSASPHTRCATASTIRRSRPTTSTATSTTPTSASTSAASAPSTGRPGDVEGYLLPFEEIGRKIEETLALHGTGVLLQGGVHPDLPLEYYEDLRGSARAIRRSTATASRRRRSSSSRRRSG
jgi:hypothetical protein